MRIKHIISFLLAVALTAALACKPRLAPKSGMRMDTRGEDIQAYIASELDTARDEWQKPDVVVEALQLETGGTVADVGAGAGYFTWRLAEAVGQNGTVYATESQTDLLELLIKHSTEGGFANVKVIETRPNDPQLPYLSVDVALVCNNMSRIDYVYLFFDMLRRSVKTGGKLAIVDWKIDSQMGPDKKKRRSADEVKKIIEGLGFKLFKQYDDLPYQYFMVFMLEERFE